MEEIGVGEYIRTNQGIIAKVTYVDGLMLDTDNDVFDVGGAMMMEIPTEFIEEYVAKHSKNIIDLIEVGDYVNGKKVLRINDYGDFKRADFNLDYDDGDAVYNDDIKTILTKEQYEQNCYKVGED